MENYFISAGVKLAVNCLQASKKKCEEDERNSAFLTSLVFKKQKTTRKVWAYPVSSSFFDDIWSNLSDERFLRKYRMSRDTFNYICTELENSIGKKNTRWREAVPVNKRVAIGLHLLKSNCDADTVADLYGVGHSTAKKIFIEFVEAIPNVLLKKHVKFPSSNEEFQKIERGFFNKRKFPGCVGAMDGSHIPIITPPENGSDYYNYKKYHSVILMAVVDSNYNFMFINTGQTGRNADSTVFSRTRLYQELTTNRMDLEDNFLIGDAAFPLHTWLMKPYIESPHMPTHEKKFNFCLSSARMVVEESFGRLKGRWRILLKRIDHSVDKVVNIINTCVILHNICEQNSDAFYDVWEDDEGIVESAYAQPLSRPHNSTGMEAKQKRDLLSHRLFIQNQNQ